MKMRERAVVHVIEPQHLFVPTLIDVFTEAGLVVDRVGPCLDLHTLLDEKPDIVFLDTDYVEEPVDAVRLARALVPSAQIVVFAGTEEATVHREFLSNGASTVLAKSAERRRIVQGLREVEHRRRKEV